MCDTVTDVTSPDSRTILDSAADSAIVALDPDGRIVSWNAGAEALFGWSAQEALGRDIGVLFTDEDRAAGVPAAERASAARGDQVVEERWMRRKDGSRFWASVIIDPIHDEHGNLLGYAKITRDITERKKAQDALRASGVPVIEFRASIVIGSGSLTHNLHRLFKRPNAVNAAEEPDCAEFREWVRRHTEGGHWPELLDYRRRAPHAEAMHPTDEHWLPFYFAAGAACDGDQPWPSVALRLHGSVTYGHLAMDAYGFGTGVDQLVQPESKA